MVIRANGDAKTTSDAQEMEYSHAFQRFPPLEPGGGGALPYMGYTGMCRGEGYGFQAVYSRIGYVHQRVWV